MIINHHVVLVICNLHACMQETYTNSEQQYGI